jgi:hypothetical protein
MHELVIILGPVIIGWPNEVPCQFFLSDSNKYALPDTKASPRAAILSVKDGLPMAAPSPRVCSRRFPLGGLQPAKHPSPRAVAKMYFEIKKVQGASRPPPNAAAAHTPPRHHAAAAVPPRHHPRTPHREGESRGEAQGPPPPHATSTAHHRLDPPPPEPGKKLYAATANIYKQTYTQR